MSLLMNNLFSCPLFLHSLMFSSWGSRWFMWSAISSSRCSSPLFHSLVRVESRAGSHSAAVETRSGSPALTHLPGDAYYKSSRLPVERRTPARCDPRTSPPHTRAQVDLTPERASSGAFWLLSIRWSRITSSVSFSSLLSFKSFSTTMDMYTSALSPALDIGTGCYLLFLSK